MKEEECLSTTGTFSSTLEEREYTADEKTILQHFFTNIDKNIYAATNAMPNCLWALLEGGYSRSHLSMRMRFLNIFEEMQEEYNQGKLPSEELVTIHSMAEQIRQGQGINLSYFLNKTEKFMRKWAVQYGHDSLKDSDVLRFAIENITQHIINPIEEAKLGAYQEKSTRYINFGKKFLVIPIDLKEFESEIKEWNNFLMDCYEESKPIVKEFLRKRLDPSTFKSEAAFERTLNAKTFDIVRYFLPATSTSSLGAVWPTREAERHISRLLSDARAEMRSVGKHLLEEGKKISPGLLNHVAVNEYQIKRRNSMRQTHQNLNLNLPLAEYGRSIDAVKLIRISPDIEARIAAAMLFHHNSTANSYEDYFQACLNNQNLIEQTFSTYLNGRGQFDPCPIATEAGNLLFSVTVDFGAYRDIMRHRRNLFLCSPNTALIGFEYPEHVAHKPELIEVKRKIELCAQKTKELHQKVKERYPYLAGYIIMFANKQNMLWQMDARQLAYVSELRTTPAGHHSYRTICQQMFKLAEPHLPTFSKYIRINMSAGEEGRQKQEEKTVEKLQALSADTTRVS